MHKPPDKISADSRTYISDDGFVFLTGGRNRVLDLYDAESFAGMVPAQYWRDTAAARQRFFELLGIPWRMMFVPEKLSVYGNAIFPDMGTDAMPTPGQRMAHLLPTAPITYPLAALNREKRNELVYLRTDSH